MSKFSRGNTKAAKLSNERVFEIRRLYHEEGWSQADLARHFKVVVNTIGRIVRGETHQDVPMAMPEGDIEASAARVASGIGLARLDQELERNVEAKVSRNLKELINYPAAEKFGVTPEGEEDEHAGNRS